MRSPDSGASVPAEPLEAADKPDGRSYEDGKDGDSQCGQGDEQNNNEKCNHSVQWVLSPGRVGENRRPGMIEVFRRVRPTCGPPPRRDGQPRSERRVLADEGWKQMGLMA